MMLRASRCALFLFAFFAVLASATSVRANTTSVNRAFVIYMENQGYDDVIGHADPSGNLDTPYITNLAFHYGLETDYFGVTHPSLPNYLALTGGSTNNINDDNASCYAVPSPGAGCHSIPYKNLVDQLESAHISWVAYEQSMPTVGYLGVRYPATGPVLYAQKHNPFVYYTDIATNAARRDHILPLDNSATQLKAALSNPATAPRFVFIAPDQCHDMHGTSTCPSGDALLRAGDNYVQTLVTTIMHSPSFTSNSVIFLTWDENDYSSNIGCCVTFVGGGGHVPTIVVTPRYTHALQIANEANHYALLRTIEAGYGLAPLDQAGLFQPVLFNLMP